MARDLLMILGAFVLASLLAAALGATNLGTALAFGQIAFAATTVYVIAQALRTIVASQECQASIRSHRTLRKLH